MAVLRRTSFVFALSLMVGVLFTVLNSFSAKAITFGKEVLNARVEYPSVLSVWYREDDFEDFYPICTGTLIEPRIVLTAAHCLDDEGVYAVGYGSDLLQNATLQQISAVWRHPGYSAKQKVNDVGLLLLEKSIPVLHTPLATKSATQRAQANRNKTLEIVGWGKNQNGELASYLRKSRVNDQSLSLAKYKGWRNDVWIAVGRYIPKEKVYSGSCNGDSGGPLFAYVNGRTVLTGITSWGAKDCEYEWPSIYVRLSYYINLINNEGIPTLLRNETTQNRAAPSVVREPKITASIFPTLSYTCDKGVWSSNTSQVTVAWSGAGVPFGSKEATIVASENNSGAPRTLTCTVTASNSNGSTRRVLTVSQPSKPVALSSPSITSNLVVASTSPTTLSCLPAIFSSASTVSTEWWTGDSFRPMTRIASGNSLTTSTNFFTQYGGSYLYCLSSATGEGGTATSQSRGTLIPSFAKPAVARYPVINGVSSSISVPIGTVATCSGWAWSNSINKEVVEWYINSNNTLTNPTLVGTGTSLTLSKSFLEQNSGKYLSCAVTATNNGGSVTAYVPVYLYFVQSKPSSPAVTVSSVHGTSASGSSRTLYSPALGDVFTCNYRALQSGESASISWYYGFWSYSSSGSAFSPARFISNNRSITLTSALLTQIGHRGGFTSYLMCEVAITGDYGTSYSYSGVDFFANLSTTTSVTPTPTPTPTPSATPTPTPTPSATPTPTPTPTSLPTFGVPTVNSVAATYVVVVQPARPSNWLNTYEFIAEVYSLDEQTRIGAASPGVDYNPGSTLSISASNSGGIAPSNSYKVRFVVRDTVSNRYTYGPFTTFSTPAPDTTRPEIVTGSGTVAKATVKFAEVFTFTFRATDNVGVASAGGIIYRPDEWPVSEIDGGVLISGNAADGIWRVSISIPSTVNKGGVENNPIGTYSIYGKATDTSGNAMRLENGSYYKLIGTISVSN